MRWIQGTMDVKVASVGFKKVRYRVIHYLPNTTFKRPLMKLIRINHITRIIIIQIEKNDHKFQFSTQIFSALPLTANIWGMTLLTILVLVIYKTQKIQNH